MKDSTYVKHQMALEEYQRLQDLLFKVILLIWSTYIVVEPIWAHGLIYDSTVSAPPSFEIKKRTQTALISENTVLECEAKGEKPIGVLWNMNNRRLDANVDARYFIEKKR